jgi:hypothetical protein
MTVHRRSHLLLAATAFLMPACISVSAQPVPLTPVELAARISAEGAARAIEPPRKSRTDFAIYHPARPGEVVPTKPVAKDTTTAQKPVPIAPAPAELAEPVAPPSQFTPTSAAAVPVARDPNIFPLSPRSATGTESPLLAAFRAHMDGKPERAFGAIAELDRTNQELILAILPVLSRGASANLAADPLAAAALVEQLHGAAARLEPLAALRVETAIFCEAVHGFGSYKAWGVNRPYTPRQKAYLYLDVVNLVSQPVVGPHGELYLTHARARAELRDAYGKVVPQPHPADHRNLVPVVEFERKIRSNSPVRDFHFVYFFPVPATPGVYTITVTVSDSAGRRSVTTQPVEFRVAGP